MTESVFTPLSQALTAAQGTIDAQEGRSLTFRGGQLAAVSYGDERPCIIMDPPPGHTLPHGGQKKGYFVCLMATFASSHGNYGSFGNLLRRFVVPVEPNEQLLPDSDMYALKTIPAWRNPKQWAIAFIIYTERPVKLFRARSNGQGRRLSNSEYDRFVQHCYNQRSLWQRDARENLNLKQEMYKELVVSPSGFVSRMLRIADWHRTGNRTRTSTPTLTLPMSYRRTASVPPPLSGPSVAGNRSIGKVLVVEVSWPCPLYSNILNVRLTTSHLCPQGSVGYINCTFPYVKSIRTIHIPANLVEISSVLNGGQ